MALTVNTKIINDVDNYLLDGKNVKGSLVVASTSSEKDALLNEVTVIAGTILSYDNKLYRCKVTNNVKSWEEIPSNTYTQGNGISIANGVISNTYNQVTSFSGESTNLLTGITIGGVNYKISTGSVAEVSWSQITGDDPLENDALASTFANYLPITETSGYYQTSKSIWAHSSSGIYVGNTTVPTAYKPTSIDVSRGNSTYTITLPSSSGTLALTSDIPSLVNYVDKSSEQNIDGRKTFDSESLLMNDITKNYTATFKFGNYGEGSPSDDIELALPVTSGNIALISDTLKKGGIINNTTIDATQTKVSIGKQTTAHTCVGLEITSNAGTGPAMSDDKNVIDFKIGTDIKYSGSTLVEYFKSTRPTTTYNMKVSPNNLTLGESTSLTLQNSNINYLVEGTSYTLTIPSKTGTLAITDDFSGTYDGTNWTSLTINGVTKDIPTSSTPSNMVTTDTEQSISGAKTFTNALTVSIVGRGSVAYGPNGIVINGNTQLFQRDKSGSIALVEDVNEKQDQLGVNPETTTQVLSGLTIDGVSYSLSGERGLNMTASSSILPSGTNWKIGDVSVYVGNESESSRGDVRRITGLNANGSVKTMETIGNIKGPKGDDGEPWDYEIGYDDKVIHNGFGDEVLKSSGEYGTYLGDSTNMQIDTHICGNSIDFTYNEEGETKSLDIGNIQTKLYRHMITGYLVDGVSSESFTCLLYLVSNFSSPIEKTSFIQAFLGSISVSGMVRYLQVINNCCSYIGYKYNGAALDLIYINPNNEVKDLYYDASRSSISDTVTPL